MPRPGRPRQNAPREGNGRINRSWLVTQTERAAMETAVSARQRLFGLSEADAKEGYAGSVVGRLVLNKVIRADQYDAAKKYLVRRYNYQRAIGAAPDFTQPKSDEWIPRMRDGVLLSPEEAWEEFCVEAKRAHEAMCAVIRAVMVSERSPDPASALDVFLVKDVHEPRLLGAFRIALNALGHHFGIQVVQTQQVAA